MPWIRTRHPDEPDLPERLRALYDQAVARAGRVFGIVRAMSVAPEVLEASMGLYQRVMFASGGLPRWRREMLAVVVSRANDCHY